MMKGVFPRLELIALRYRLIWHGRFFGFRLVSTATQHYDECVSYSNFGPFAVGGVDLLCGHYQPLNLTSADGKAILTGPGTLSVCDQRGVFLVEHRIGNGTLRVWVACATDSPHLRLTFEPMGFDSEQPLLLSLPGNLIYDQKQQEDSSAAFYSTGTATGLRVAGESPGCVAVVESPESKTLVCRLPANRMSAWVWTVLGPGEGLGALRERGPEPGRMDVRRLDCEPAKISELESWERQTLKQMGWEPERGGVKERIAGVYVTAKDCSNPVSWLPEGRMDYIERVLLPKLVETRSFQAVGFSRDGVTEKGENAQWLRLVERTHRSGLRVYMKPGDGELTALGSRAEIDAWAKACFDVAEVRRCDVVRLPWEAVLVPWVTANLCLPARFHTEGLRNLSGLSWGKVQDRIVTSVADRFSYIIEAIRRHAPGITIDIESGDTAVLERLQQRHGNLGVMYMCYGQYPEVADYLDLYHAVARRQQRASRVVLETDCYYSSTITSLQQLKGGPYEKMYSERDIELMAQKHRHMNNLSAEAAWAWGTNITFTERKLKAVAKAHG